MTQTEPAQMIQMIYDPVDCRIKMQDVNGQWWTPPLPTPERAAALRAIFVRGLRKIYGRKEAKARFGI